MIAPAVLEPGGSGATALYIVAFSLFIIGVKQGTHPTSAKRGNLIAAGGMAVAVVTTLLLDGMGNWGLIVVGYANDGLEYVIGTIAIAFGTINIVGGFMVTDRMLGMFSRKRPATSSAPASAKKSEDDSPSLPRPGAAGSEDER